MVAIDQKPQIEFLEDIEPEPTKDHVLVDETGEVQRLPVPSNDPNDPLNFSKWEKFGVVFSCCWFCGLFSIAMELGSN
jgi:hypothetical protein